MQENITISRNRPALKSMDFNFLKEEGIRRIQELAGDIWTDYNEHDPGVTLLEAMCYAITDLGYRTSFDMRDLLAPNPSDDINDHYNFYTARQILLNNPLTIKDFRKMLMDVSVVVKYEEGKEEKIGVKNAWITIADRAEYDVFISKEESLLQYVPPKIGDQQPLDIKVLYDVVLEFSDSEKFGDLNSDILEARYDLFHPANSQMLSGQQPDGNEVLAAYDQRLFDNLSGMSSEELANASAQSVAILDTVVKVKVEFPRWDEADLDWEDPAAVKSAIKNLELTFFNLPDDLNIIYKLDEQNNILLASGRDGIKGKPVPFIDDITNRINCLILGQVNSLLAIYQEKVLTIREILRSARATLNAHRNLCEDFKSFKALRVEEIVVCSDIEVDANADVAAIEGKIFYLLDNFLSPTVNFYSLDEILQKDLENKKYQKIKIDKEKNRITVLSEISQTVGIGMVISLVGYASNVFEATIAGFSDNLLDSKFTDITVEEDLSELTVTENGYLLIGRVSESSLRPVEDVFEGPALKNGFIEDEELRFADRRLSINASDIINLIMDVDGVKAVRSLQLANIPQDENPDVPSRSVRWCLKLATNLNYVPRISKSKSSLTYYRNGFPFQPSTLESDEIFESLKASRRPQKLLNPKLDLEIPKGEYRELSEFISIQEDLPLNYGVGVDGVAVDHLSKQEANTRIAKVKQLKGYLMIFDQMLSNYLMQLDRMKDLFSFNPLRKSALEDGDVLPEEYNFQVNKTYFSQSLYSAVSDYAPLYVNYSEGLSEEKNNTRHSNDLQKVLEDRSTFIKRRNKFLDHLIARFGEQFTDYALLNARIDSVSKETSDLELIEDKQDFLSRYPDLSANRGKAFNYRDPEFWHPDNVSGLEKRVAFMSGVDPAEVSDLAFDPLFVQTHEEGNRYTLSFLSDDDVIFESKELYHNENEAKTGAESFIVLGLCRANYRIRCRKEEGEKRYRIHLLFNDETIGQRPGYLTSSEEANEELDKLIALFEGEFYNNPLSNRKNFTLPFNSYFQTDIKDEDINIAEETFVIRWKMYARPFSFEEAYFLLEGTFNGQIDPEDLDSIEEIKRSAEQKVRSDFWQTVYLGRDGCQFNAETGRITIIDRLGEEIARGEADQINDVLEDTLQLDKDVSDVQKAVAKLSLFFENTFFRQEGFHLIEHILMRPRVNDVLVDAEAEFIRDIPENDSFIPYEFVIGSAGEMTGEGLKIAGDHTDKMYFNQQVTLATGSLKRTFIIDSYRVEDGFTFARIRNITRSFIGKDDIQVTLSTKIRIVDIKEETLQLVVKNEPEGWILEPGDMITIFNASRTRNYGEFSISDFDRKANQTTLTLDRYKVTDRLLPIYLPQPDNDIIDPDDCDTCKLKNPYSYIAQVVVPGWPGRMDNIDFRKFFETTMRQEAPAHVFLNICWVSYEQMETFERCYKRWLLQNLKEFPVKPYEEKDKKYLSDLAGARADLIEIIYQLRNIYPVRALHDCDQGNSTDDAIILNQTALGEI